MDIITLTRISILIFVCIFAARTDSQKGIIPYGLTITAIFSGWILFLISAHTYYQLVLYTSIFLFLYFGLWLITECKYTSKYVGGGDALLVIGIFCLVPFATGFQVFIIPVILMSFIFLMLIKLMKMLYYFLLAHSSSNKINSVATSVFDLQEVRYAPLLFFSVVFCLLVF
jgi:hypothetical protein